MDMDTSWLEQVIKITTGERRRDYGRPLINHVRIALNWSNFLGVTVTPDKVIMMMFLLKTAREQNTPKEDNWIDIIGYGACADDIHKHMQELGYEKGLFAFKDMDVLGLQALYQILLEHEKNERENSAYSSEATNADIKNYAANLDLDRRVAGSLIEAVNGYYNANLTGG